MSKEMAVIAFGIWVMAIPYLGVPGAWRTAFLVITGAALVVLGLFLRAATVRARQRGASFVEYVPEGPDEPRHEHKEGIGPLN